MNNVKQFWSAQEIADDIKSRLSQVLYVIEKEQIQCIDVIANRRVYSVAQKERIIEVFNRIQEDKKCQ